MVLSLLMKVAHSGELRFIIFLSRFVVQVKNLRIMSARNLLLDVFNFFLSVYNIKYINTGN